MNCPKCGYENPENAVECADCGVIFSRISFELEPLGEEQGSMGEGAHGRMGVWGKS